MQKYLIAFVAILAMQLVASAQSCNLDTTNFQGYTNLNPPPGWIRGVGTNIGSTFPSDSINDPAAGFNNPGEYITSKEYDCVGQICFDWRASNSTPDFDIEIAFTQDLTTWVAFDTITSTGADTATKYRQYCTSLPPNALVPPFNSRIRWMMIRDDRGSFYLDNTCVTDTYCVVTPTELQFSPISDQCRETGIPITVKVCATDTAGFVSDSFGGMISISKLSGPGGLSGALNYTAIQGCALISDISLDGEGEYLLQATSGAFSGQSDTIVMTDNCPDEVNISVMSYNLLNYSSGRNDCGANTLVPNRWDTLEKIVHYYLPDVLMVCEIQNDTLGVNQILNASLNSNGYSNYAAADFVLNQSPGGTNFNNMLYFNSNKLTLYSQAEIGTLTRDFNKYTMYVNDPGLAITQDTIFLDFYMAHLKAGSASVDSFRRTQECDSLRLHLDSRPDRNSILGGDLNFYSASEQGYQTLLSGVNPLNDPVDMPGDWDGDFAFRLVHTQSSRGPGDPTFDCGFNGGADSRFDFLLISNAITNNTLNTAYVDSSYATLGNDGSIFNKAINDPANTSGVPQNILNAMYYMSDHLPVVMEMNVTLPAVACAENLIISAIPIEAGDYKASQTIMATGIINDPDVVLFQAGNCIGLNEEFEVMLGAEFEVKIGDCH